MKAVDAEKEEWGSIPLSTNSCQRASVDRKRVARLWVRRGLSDLYFAFDSGHDTAFEDNERFSEIMGLEKFLKAVLLYHEFQQYERLSDQNAREKLHKLARKIGHVDESILEDLRKYIPQDTDRIRESDFDGYIGSALIAAVSDGYMETRYPVPRSTSDKFSIPGTGFTHDPLASSGFTKYVYALCNACFYHLVVSEVQFSEMYSDFRYVYQHRESLVRFENLFWEERCRFAL